LAGVFETDLARAAGALQAKGGIDESAFFSESV
jgi:hypothetical protein